MRKPLLAAIVLLLPFMLTQPPLIEAQTTQTSATCPPVEQPLVREGALAVDLAEALRLASTTDEVEAETVLGKAGISPRNGWIADYPVTPDIMGELEESIVAAADSGAISMQKDEALKTFETVLADSSLTVRPATPGEGYGGTPPHTADYPNPETVCSHYTSQGPPMVTYYTPPPDYYYLYSWVPYPFWWGGLWFPGFFILHDFHKTIIVKNRPFFITNHFNHLRTHRVFRIDPVQRFHGRTFAGIGVHGNRGFISTGIPRAPERVFNPGRHQVMPGGGGRFVGPTPQGRTFGPSSGGRMAAPPHSGGRTMGPPSGSGRGPSPGRMSR